MLGNSFSDYDKSQGYKFLAGEKVKIRVNGKTRPAEISRGYSSSKGEFCYSGRFLDNGGEECFIEISEILIHKKTNPE